jgi:acetyl-CoA synthetase
MGDLQSIEKIFVVRHTGDDAPMTEGRDVWFHEAMEAADPECPAAELDAEHPLFILYTSGSTAKPKGILHTTGGYLTGVAWTTKHVFDLRADEDVWFCSADVGWVTGHSYIVYGPLANGATSVMYEGAPDYPHKGIWWELCATYGVTTFYTAPTAIRACMKWGPQHVEATTCRGCGCSARSASRSTRRPGCGTGRWSAAGAVPSWTRGGRRRRARS